ncbi:DUF3761 domain-containing protein [Streptomyces asoensis]|uniref:DUF3761 domain-containing protein n=3 Tax=Streptomyces TaxID=1883 RepID=A0ABQ3SCC1_9ACTN|nr:hypothetical protein GCM10010496_73480 [Streptomyces asoensis]GHI65765.1 hypothetical protein Saso_74150 [Streptomyces asoensis]
MGRPAVESAYGDEQSEGGGLAAGKGESAAQRHGQVPGEGQADAGALSLACTFAPIERQASVRLRLSQPRDHRLISPDGRCPTAHDRNSRTLEESFMLTTLRSAVTATLMAGALLAPVALATDAAAASCARHTTGVCKANSPHPRGATAKCKDGTYSYSASFRGTCSHHRGVKYWYR